MPSTYLECCLAPRSVDRSLSTWRGWELSTASAPATRWAPHCVDNAVSVQPGSRGVCLVYSPIRATGLLAADHGVDGQAGRLEVLLADPEPGIDQAGPEGPAVPRQQPFLELRRGERR